MFLEYIVKHIGENLSGSQNSYSSDQLWQTKSSTRYYNAISVWELLRQKEDTN